MFGRNTMGIIKAVTSSVGGGLADQWLEVIEPQNMSDTTVMTKGVAVSRDSRRNQNKKGSPDVITDGSVVLVGEGQCMLLLDGGKVSDYSAEAGYYQVTNDNAPSLFNGDLSAAVKETFSRVKFGGVPSVSQKVLFINMQEIKNIAFGTPNPINYFDGFYNAELYLRAHGYFSIRIVDPIKFYLEAIPKNIDQVDIADIHKLYLAEFLTALQTAICKMSVDGIRISHVSSKATELAKYMTEVLDEAWTERRGMIIESVGIASLSYDEQSKKLIDIRNQGAMLSDASIREGYVQGSVARGIENAGSNQGGAAQAFMAVNMANQQAGGVISAAAESNRAQTERQAASGWTCVCGQQGNSGEFCPKCGKKKQDVAEWTCACGEKSTGAFCPSCGAAKSKVCATCGAVTPAGAAFCPKCGGKL